MHLAGLFLDLSNIFPRWLQSFSGCFLWFCKCYFLLDFGRGWIIASFSIIAQKSLWIFFDSFSGSKQNFPGSKKVPWASFVCDSATFFWILQMSHIPAKIALESINISPGCHGVRYSVEVSYNLINVFKDLVKLFADLS